MDTRLVITFVLGFMAGVGIALIFFGLSPSLSTEHATTCTWKDVKVFISYNSFQVKAYCSGKCYVDRVIVEYKYLDQDMKPAIGTEIIHVGREYTDTTVIVTRELDLEGLLTSLQPWRITIVYNHGEKYTVEVLPNRG